MGGDAAPIAHGDNPVLGWPHGVAAPLGQGSGGVVGREVGGSSSVAGSDVPVSVPVGRGCGSSAWGWEGFAVTPG